MAIERRPVRPATRVPMPALAPRPAAPGAPARSPTARVASVPPQKGPAKTATAKVASVSAPGKSPTARVAAVSGPPRKATGRLGRADRGSSRGSAAAPKNNTPLIIGASVGGLILIVIIAVAMSGGDKKHAEPAGVKKTTPEKPDVSKLERDGLSKCNEGVRLIKNAMASNDKDGLERGVALISEGNGLLDKANTLGNTGGYDTKEINQTLYLARKKLQELRN
jgi:hypothetical protein